MVIIAKTEDGVLLQASEGEIKDLMKCVSFAPDELNIGDKIPIYDYSAALKSIKTFTEEYYFRNFKSTIESISASIKELEELS